jgi:hypothetical protein
MFDGSSSEVSSFIPLLTEVGGIYDVGEGNREKTSCIMKKKEAFGNDFKERKLHENMTKISRRRQEKKLEVWSLESIFQLVGLAAKVRTLCRLELRRNGDL